MKSQKSCKYINFRSYKSGNTRYKKTEMLVSPGLLFNRFSWVIKYIIGLVYNLKQFSCSEVGLMSDFTPHTVTVVLALTHFVKTHRELLTV